VFLLEKSGNSDTLLVWLHGGPYRQAALGYHPYTSYGGYDWILETARQSDVGVLKLDYPGSAGFGRVFAESISGHVGVKDATDAAAAISDFAKRNSYKNVYLMGNSYGGYLALKLLVNKPTVYKGAMSIAGVADWTTMLTALDTSIFNLQFGGTAGNDNFDEYARASIYNHVNKLSGQKIVLVHGDKDSTIPIKQSAGLATFLEQNGKPAKLITLSGENHVFKKPESFETVCNATLEFVGKTGGAPCKP
jgi:dipeptidyl aminopeptidase/acylaminoacyl peptidase